jgi:hypothetical protein
MGNAVAIAFFTVLALLTFIAGRTWYQRRGTAEDQARDRVFRRFVTGLIVFWILAVSWFLWREGGPREAAKVLGLVSDRRLAMVARSERSASLRQHHVGDQGRLVERHLLAPG